MAPLLLLLALTWFSSKLLWLTTDIERLPSSHPHPHRVSSHATSAIFLAISPSSCMAISLVSDFLRRGQEFVLERGTILGGNTPDYMTVGITPLKIPIDDWYHGGGIAAYVVSS